MTKIVCVFFVVVVINKIKKLKKKKLNGKILKEILSEDRLYAFLAILFKSKKEQKAMSIFMEVRLIVRLLQRLC